MGKGCLAAGKLCFSIGQARDMAKNEQSAAKDGRFVMTMGAIGDLHTDGTRAQITSPSQKERRPRLLKKGSYAAM